ncbi:MAG: glycosyltransferase, partial [Bacteroidaceae bacterium]|nr:glycosyltransferase [Bacteroidaceae bacterium]
NDELVVSLDPSKDASEEIIKSYMNSDSRVKLYYGKGKGAISNFENAIRHCRNSIIFLADQDDVWQPDKVRRVLAEFENPKAQLIAHRSLLNPPQQSTIRGLSLGIHADLCRACVII